MSQQEQLFYTVEEVAARFGVNRKTVCKWIRANDLKAIKTPGRGKWLVPIEEVERKCQAGFR